MNFPFGTGGNCLERRTRRKETRPTTMAVALKGGDMPALQNAIDE